MQSIPRRPDFAVALTLAVSLLTGSVPGTVAPTSALASAQGAETNATVTLKFLSPTDFIHILTDKAFYAKSDGVLDPEPPEIKGLRRLTPHELDRTVEIEGTSEAIAEVTSLMRLLDLEPREAILTLSVTRIRLSANGARVRKVVGKPRMSTTNNATASVDVTGKYRVSVTPHINGDDSISLAVSGVFPEGGKQDGVINDNQVFVRIMNGEKRRFRFVAAAARPETRAAFRGKGFSLLANDDKDFEYAFKGQTAVVYYVDITANAPPPVPPPPVPSD